MNLGHVSQYSRPNWVSRKAGGLLVLFSKVGLQISSKEGRIFGKVGHFCSKYTNIQF